MNRKLHFINSTAKAGIFFIIPIAIVLLILIKVIGLISPVSGLIGDVIDPKGVVPLISLIISIILIFLIFFLGGIIENRFAGSKKLISWIENNILSSLPAYQLIKSNAQQKVGLDMALNLKVVLVPTDGWVLAFQVEELANNEVLVFIPSSPNPHEGNLNLFHKSEVRNTNLTQNDAYAILRKTGIGTRSIFDKAHLDTQKD